MEALVFSNGTLNYQATHPEPRLGADEVLIEVSLAGICSTDLEIIKGYMGFSGILGHEFVGTVVKGARKLLGKRVVAEINCVCGKCDMCLSGLSSHCRVRQVIGIDARNGGFADYIAVPERNVHVLPDSLTNDEAIFVEPLAAAIQIAQQVPIEKRYKVVVVGDGRLGLLVVQVMAYWGGKKNVLLLGKHEDKLTFADKRGIRTQLLNEMIIRPEWDVVVDCTGAAEGFTTCSQLVRPRGKLVLKSTWAAKKTVDLTPLVINEVTLIGSRCGPFANGINALAAQHVVVNGMITARYKLSDGVKAVNKASKTDQIKVVLDIKK